MSESNGLICCPAFANVDTPFYLSKGEDIVKPTILQPLYIEADDNTTNATLFVSGASSGAYQGAINIQPGVNATSTVLPGAGITIRTAVGPSTITEIGSNAQSNNLLYIAGASGVSQVYDEKYNPVINSTAVASRSSSLPDTTGFTYTPDKTGAYMLQVDINIRNADTIPTLGFIEWVMSDGAEVQYASNTISSVSLIKVAGMNDINGVPGGVAEPTDFTSSNLCFLTAGVAVSFSITTARNSLGGGGQWAIDNYQARLIQMC
jgi:hypothetical protein